MIEVIVTEFPHYVQDQFDTMQIPGNGTGFAVCHTAISQTRYAAFGKNDSGWVGVRYSGDGCRVQKMKPVGIEDCRRVASILTSKFRKSAFVGAADILDGESYLVKWSEGNQTEQLIVCNPREASDAAIGGFVDELDELIRSI